MRLDFQRHIANSTIVLPVVCVVSVLLWAALPHGVTPSDVYSAPDYGLWRFFPSVLLGDNVDFFTALGLAAIAVYLTAELNNRHALLRISSRMISSVLALLCALTVSLHQPQPAYVLMLLTLLSYFPLLQSYQHASPLLSFITFLCLSSASLVFPKALALIPLYWILQVYLRAFSLRCFIASLMAVALPWWLCFGAMFYAEELDMFVGLVCPLAAWQWCDYTQLRLEEILPVAFAFLLFVVGTVDFRQNSFLDKTHTRSVYHAVIAHGLYIIICICLQPQYIAMLLPVFLIDTAILFGHFFALTYTRASHIVSLVLAALAVALAVVTAYPSLITL